MSEYKVAHLDEIEVVDDGREPMQPVRHHLGISAFGINAWTGAQKGDRLINEHDEEDDGQEEVYLVMHGHAVFEVGGERVDAPAGTFVFVRPGVRRTAFAEEPETTLIVVGGVPGKPYEAGGWEVWAPLRPLYEAGEYEALIERGRELIEANPQYPVLFYNLACCEALAGRTTDAIEHLRHAVERSDQARDYAKSDSDFDSIREEPAFKELIGD